MKRKKVFSDFKEEFQLRAIDKNPMVNIEWKKAETYQFRPEHEFYAVEYEQRFGKIKIVVDGKELPLNKLEIQDIPMEIQFINSSIMEYRIKKI